MPLQIVDDAGNAVALPEGVSFEKVEDITGLVDKAKKHDEIEADPNFKNWHNTRQIIADKDGQIATLSQRLKELGGQSGPQPGEPIKTEQVGEIVQRELTKKEVERVNKKVDNFIQEAAGGDENRAKVIKEKFEALKGNRDIASEEEAAQLLEDAVFLTNKNRETAFNPLHRVAGAGGGGSGGPNKGNTEDRSRAVSNLQAMGYRFKGDSKRFTNK